MFYKQTHLKNGTDICSSKSSSKIIQFLIQLNNVDIKSSNCFHYEIGEYFATIKELDHCFSQNVCCYIPVTYVYIQIQSNNQCGQMVCYHT
jgi:hypothetical protein